MQSRPGYDFLVLFVHRLRTVSCGNPHGTDVLDDFGSQTRVRKIIEIPLKTLSQRLKTAKTHPKIKKRRSWLPLGASWGLLGPLGTVLTTILRPTNRKIENKIENCQCWRFWGVDFGVQNASQNDPKAIPKRFKNQDEKRITFLSLGTVLERSWVDLGLVSGSKKAKKH